MNRSTSKQHKNTNTFGLVAWHSGNTFHPINEVTLCRAGLVFG